MSDESKKPATADAAPSNPGDVKVSKRQLLKKAWIAPAVVTLASLSLSSAQAGTTAPPMS